MAFRVVFEFNTDYIRIKHYEKVWVRIVLSFQIITEDGGTNFLYYFEQKIYMSRQLIF